MASYAVILTFPEQVESELDSLRAEYRAYVGYAIPPHITLRYSFILRADLSVIRERLKAVADKTRPFVVVLDGVEYFEGDSNVAYAAIKDKRPVVDLHSNIFRSLRGLVKEEYEENGEYVLDRFIPHVTIGEHIPDQVLPEAKRVLASHEVNYKAKMGSFSLYSQMEDRIWKAVDRFRLSGR